MTDRNILVKKASGALDAFSSEKLRKSLERAGADATSIDSIEQQVNNILYDGIPAKEIYRTAFRLLKKQSKGIAGRYNLKKAIMALGPSGYPFEKYIAAVFAWEGYKVKTQQLLKGKCVTHEIDVFAENDSKALLIECKYHSGQGNICDVKIPLYIHSRYMDVLQHRQLQSETKPLEGWVITNTKFSSDALHYGICSGLHLLGWNFPEHNGLAKLVDNSKLYPITCLTTISTKEKAMILEKGIVLCKDLEGSVTQLQEAGIPDSRIKSILNETELLCSLEKNNHVPR
ncbi:MAG: restriction endonuclease [Bacteroidetes bacterium]|jgi:hypothetical protein|nr:restriction endonuclease [Bacteroidota bacterium]